MMRRFEVSSSSSSSHGDGESETEESPTEVVEDDESSNSSGVDESSMSTVDGQLAYELAYEELTLVHFLNGTFTKNVIFTNSIFMILG